MPFGLVDLVDGADVGMVVRCGGLGLANEALLALLVLDEMRREELQGDETIELEIFGLVDHAHAAASDLGDDLVVGDGFTDHGRVVNLI